MNTIKTQDGTEIFYKDWGAGAVHDQYRNLDVLQVLGEIGLRKMP